MAIATAWKAVTRKGLVGSSPTSSALNINQDMMNFFENVSIEQFRIEKIIKKYGYAPEHNFWWYQSQADKNEKNVFVEFDDGTGLFTIEGKDKKRVTIFSSPIAPPLRRVLIIIEYLQYIFQSSEIKKVKFELETPLFKELIEALPSFIKARAINYTLTWPIYDIKSFNPVLTGKHWKTLRKEKNKFYQNHRVNIVDARTYENKKALHLIIDQWREKRQGHDRSHFFPYHNFIDGNFIGSAEARVFVVDDKAVGINAGWLIPNSNRFYGALGIHDYSLTDLGDVLYLEDLVWLKMHGYIEADMGGGEDALTYFKSKFLPKSFYKTHIFSVVKR